jgi:hypothetical protein
VRITIRLNDEEERKLNELQEQTGLSTTAIVKKCVFDNSEKRLINKNIIGVLGKVSTNVNLAKSSLYKRDNSLVRRYLTLIEEGVNEIWQTL